MTYDLDRPADLTIWPRSVPARTAESRSFRTLWAALDAASEAMSTADVQAWIITDEGDILPPNWIEASLQTRRVPAQ